MLNFVVGLKKYLLCIVYNVFWFVGMSLIVGGIIWFSSVVEFVLILNLLSRVGFLSIVRLCLLVNSVCVWGCGISVMFFVR